VYSSIPAGLATEEKEATAHIADEIEYRALPKDNYIFIRS